MSLRRPLEQRVALLCFAALFLGGAVVTWIKVVTSTDSGMLSRVVAGLVGLGAGSLGAWLAFEMLRPFRFHIGPDGLDIRHRGLRRRFGWHELEAVVLDDGRARRAGIPAARLLIVPARGVQLGRRLDEVVDGQSALTVLSLDDVKDHPEDVAEALTRYGAGRFRNASRRVAVDLDGVPLHRLCEGEEGARTLRWLRRRGTMAFAAWYLLLVLPVLAAARLLAGVNDVLGVLLLLAGSVAIWVVGGRLFTGQQRCRAAVEETARLRGTSLVTGFDEAERSQDLHAGRACVQPPGQWWRGRATALAFTAGHRRAPVGLLLSDPRTGRPRAREDLDALARVLMAGHTAADGDAGRAIAELAATAPAASSPASSRRPRDEETTLWQAAIGLGRVLRWLIVVLTFAVAGGATWPYDPDRVLGGTGALLIGMSALLLGSWFLYLFYQLSQVLAAIGGVIGRPSAR
jgi:hypothetical protein